MAEPLNATFFAFKKRERRGVLTGASIAFAVLAIFVLLAAYEAACLRWMIRGETKGFFGLALDADTWRVYGIYWVWFVGFIIGAVAFVILMGILGATIAATAGADSPVMLILPLLFFIVPIYLCTRLAPAAATAIAERRFAFFDAWSTSRDRFWALFGAFFLLWLIYIVLACGITLAWLSWAVGPRLAEIFAAGSDPTAVSIAINQATMDAMAAPGGMLVYAGVTVVTWIIAILFYVALYGVNARAAVAALEEGKITPEPAS